MAPATHPHEPVAPLLERLGEAARDDEEDGEQPDAGQEQLRLREQVAGPLDQGDAGQRAAERRHAADHGHREHEQAHRRRVGRLPDAAQGDGVQAAGHAGQHAREDEGGQPGLGRVDAGRRCAPLVVAGGRDRPPGAGRLEVADDVHARPDQNDRQRVQPALVGQVEHAPELGALVRGGHPPLVVGRVEEVELHRHREREGRHGQELARDAQRRQAEQEGDDATGHARQDEADEQVDVAVGDEVGRDDRTDAHDRHLAEADDAAPAGQHHEGQRHEPVGERDRAEVDLRVGAQHRQRQHRHHHQARQHGLGRAHLAELGVGPRQPVADADDRPRRLARRRPGARNAAAAAGRRR